MKKPLLPRLALPCLAPLLFIAPALAEAATIYRCGPAGNVYSDAPCADGRVLQASDPRTEAQRLDGLRVAALEQRFAAELRRERLQREAAPQPMAAGFGTRPVTVTPAAPEPRIGAKRHGHKRGPAALRWPAPGADFVAIARAPGKAAQR